MSKRTFRVFSIFCFTRFCKWRAYGVYIFRPLEDKEEVFDLFASAALTGNLLTIGKLIDKTFGLGTFRKIGEMGNDQAVQKEMFDLIQG